MVHDLKLKTEILLALTGFRRGGSLDHSNWDLLLLMYGYPVRQVVQRIWLVGSLGCLQSCRTKGFPTPANFESNLSVSVLMWSAKNGIPKSSCICLLLTYQGALVAMRRHLN
ncbi:hypothetical protein L798_11150 [Zootermopsis nevadensis]|uniref:Uncharacterized protein n=1 Tax=Zootermopsis nevadensis TaxID=136037 RepID=A0A067RIS4_ZOONE|nr:hypothetical protein L798_11150 [Zootermopsis nevadensis]